MDDDKAKTCKTEERGGANDKPSDLANQVGLANERKGSSPIEIKPSSGGPKFGVISSRQSPDPQTGLLTDSNGEPIPLDKIIKTANTMSSMMMAHKIALEDDFKLEPGMDMAGPLMSLSPIIGSSPPRASSSANQASEPSLQSRVKDIVHDAYWDLFKEEVTSQSSDNKEERKFDISKQLLRDVKKKINDLLLPQHTRLKQDIEDRLDSQILDQLSRVDSLNLMDYAKYILDILSKLCAPVRDEKLRDLSETTDLVQLYRGIMELLELMRLDFANFTLNRFKPHIKAHSQEYEREKFSEILEQQQSIGIDGLEYTKIWLARAVERVIAQHGIFELFSASLNMEIGSEATHVSSTSSNPDGCPISLPSKEDKIMQSGVVNKILNSAYCELLEWTSDLQKLYPETLVFDEATFKQLGEQYKVLILTSSILLTTFAFLSKFKLHDNNEFRVLIKSHVITLLTASYDTGTSTSNDSPKPSIQDDSLDTIKLETIASKLSADIRGKLEEVNKSLIESFDTQKETFRRHILDLENSTNRVRELARRRILEFVETLLTLDVEHQQKKLSAHLPPPINIPLGLNCLADEITLTMAQLVKIVRYNRRVFFQHYQNAIVDLVSKRM